MAEDDDEVGGPLVVRKFIGALSSPTAVAIQVAVALLSLVLAGYVLVAQVNLTNCLASYNERAAIATAARGAAYNQTLAADQVDTEAEDELWFTVEHNQALPVDKRQPAMVAAFEKFLSERARAKKMRADAAAYRAGHPLPEPPSQQCG